MIQKGKVTFVLALFVLLIIGGCGSSEISLVKEGTLGYDETMTVGDAIEGSKYVEKVDWSALETKQKQKVVQADVRIDSEQLFNDWCEAIDNSPGWFTDSANHKQDLEKIRKELSTIKDTYVILQFSINKDGKTFDYNYGGVKIIGDNGERESTYSSVIERLYQNETPFTYMDYIQI